MKYLKLFENHGDKFKSIEDYEFNQKIFDSPYGDVDTSIFDKYEEEYWGLFTDSQIKKIRKVILNKSLRSTQSTLNTSVYPKRITNRSTKEYIEINITGMDSINIYVYSFKDSWYYVCLHGYYSNKGKRELVEEKYYECDQWDGLLECLKDIDI